MLKKAQEGGREVIKLNIAVRRSLGRPGSTMMMGIRLKSWLPTDLMPTIR